jgi:hypothetical protein
MFIVGKFGTLGIGMVNTGVFGISGTFVSGLTSGVCTTVQLSLTTVTMGSIFVPGAYVCDPDCAEVVDFPSPKSRLKLEKVPFIINW